MPLKNTLNISELLKRMGVVGDSLGSAELLEQLRLGVNVADLSQLVPPLRGPSGAGFQHVVPGANNVSNWSLQCRSQGGLQILTAHLNTTPNNSNTVDIFITTTVPWTPLAVVAQQQFSFGQVTDSVMTVGTTEPPLAIASAVRSPHNRLANLVKDIWLGPGLFLNFESSLINNPVGLSISWKEYPGAINP